MSFPVEVTQPLKVLHDGEVAVEHAFQDVWSQGTNTCKSMWQTVEDNPGTSAATAVGIGAAIIFHKPILASAAALEAKLIKTARTFSELSQGTNQVLEAAGSLAARLPAAFDSGRELAAGGTASTVNGLAKLTRAADHNQGTAVTFGVAGNDGAMLVGALMKLERSNVEIGPVTGVSAGGLVGAFQKNGYKAAQIARILCREFNKPDGREVLDAVAGPSKLWSWLRGNAFDHGPFLKRIVDTYGLKPQDDLGFVSFDLLSGETKVTAGRDLDLLQELKKTTAYPGKLNGVFDWSGGRPHLWADGGLGSRAPVHPSGQPTLAFHVEADVPQLRAALNDSNMLFRWAGNKYLNRVIARWAREPAVGPHKVIGLQPYDHPVRLTPSLTADLIKSGAKQTESALRTLTFNGGTRLLEAAE